MRVSGTQENTGAWSKSQAACRQAGSPNSWPRDWVLCRTKQDLASRDLGCEAGCQKGDIGSGLDCHIWVQTGCQDRTGGLMTRAEAELDTSHTLDTSERVGSERLSPSGSARCLCPLSPQAVGTFCSVNRVPGFCPLGNHVPRSQGAP